MTIKQRVKKCIYQCGNQIETEFLNKTCHSCQMNYHDVRNSHNIVELYDYCIDQIEQQHRNYNEVLENWTSATLIYDSHLSENIIINQDEKEQLLEKFDAWLILVKEWAFLESASQDDLVQYCLNKLKLRQKTDSNKEENQDSVPLFKDWDDGTFITESLGLAWVVAPKMLKQLINNLDKLIATERNNQS